MFRIINQKVEFNKDNEHLNVRETEQWLPSISLSPGKFTDAGYRFKKNVFEQFKYWFPFSPSNIIKFYNIEFFNHDEFDVDPA